MRWQSVSVARKQKGHTSGLLQRGHCESRESHTYLLIICKHRSLRAGEEAYEFSSQCAELRVLPEHALWFSFAIKRIFLDIEGKGGPGENRRRSCPQRMLASGFRSETAEDEEKEGRRGRQIDNEVGSQTS